jgi:hypothetical protein
MAIYSVQVSEGSVTGPRSVDAHSAYVGYMGFDTLVLAGMYRESAEEDRQTAAQILPAIRTALPSQ